MGTFKQVFLWLKGSFLLERPQYFQWLPVLLGAGIACYFVLPFEPPPAYTALAGIAALLPVFALWRKDKGRIAAIAAACLVFGFALAQGRTFAVGTMPLQNEIGPLKIQGKITDIEREEEGGRLTVEVTQWEKYDPAELPRKVRIRARDDLANFHPGQIIDARVILRPAPEPVIPGGYDFARHLYFLGIGAVGFALGDVTIAKEQAEENIWTRVQKMRDRIILETHGQLDGDNAALAAALITSEQSGLTEEAQVAMRASGLQHILSVSGLHLTMVSGLLFLLVRYSLLLAGLGLRYPIKKIAAAAAILAAFAYLVISGFAVPTQRSFLMISVLYLAVLVDRFHISLRLVAIAALLILAVTPESLMGPSFQLSFAAVVALIAAFEYWRRRAKVQKDQNLPTRIFFYICAAAFTTFIATIATAPIVAFHFNQIAVQGLIANMLATPLTGFWIMPWMIAALILMPFGLAAWPLKLMGYGTELLLQIAYWVAGLPYAVQFVPEGSAAAVILMMAGGLWLCLWQEKWRVLGVVPIVLGIFLWAVPPADVWINRDGTLLGVRGDSGILGVSTLKKDKFSAKIWGARLGQKTPVDWRDETLWGDNGHFRCDSMGCILSRNGKLVSFIRDKSAYREDCGGVDAIIVPFRAREECGSTMVLDKTYLSEKGATTLRLLPGGIEVVSVNDLRGKRPWSGKALEEDQSDAPPDPDKYDGD